MKSDIHFWTATMGRGILALVFGSAVMIFPDLATTMIFLPLAVALSVLCLAAYGLIDSLIVFGSSFTACSRAAKIVLSIQGIVGTLVATAMLSFVFDRVRLEWFLFLIAIQALCTAGAEFIVGHHVFTRSESIWDYAAAAVAAVCGIAYLIAGIFFDGALTVREIEWLIYGYLTAYGIALSVTAARMLYTDYKLSATLYTADARP
jgi:hypothetical protein